MRNLCDEALMQCDVAALPFQAHAKYGTWSIDFACGYLTLVICTDNDIEWCALR